MGIWCQNDVVSTSMRRHHVASTLIRRHFYVMCPLGSICKMRCQHIQCMERKSSKYRKSKPEKAGLQPLDTCTKYEHSTLKDCCAIFEKNALCKAQRERKKYKEKNVQNKAGSQSHNTTSCHQSAYQTLAQLKIYL